MTNASTNLKIMTYVSSNLKSSWKKCQKLLIKTHQNPKNEKMKVNKRKMSLRIKGKNLTVNNKYRKMNLIKYIWVFKAMINHLLRIYLNQMKLCKKREEQLEKIYKLLIRLIISVILVTVKDFSKLIISLIKI